MGTTMPPQQATGIPCQRGQTFAPSYLLVPGMPQFSQLPLESQWESIWDKVAFNANADFCSTPIRGAVRLPSPNHGFGSQMNNFVNEVLVSMYSHIPMTL